MNSRHRSFVRRVVPSRVGDGCWSTSWRRAHITPGHLTFDACRTSQFEQQLVRHLRFPAGPRHHSAGCHGESARDLWTDGEPQLGRPSRCRTPLHLYGKSSPRPGRKMGHITVMAPTANEARERTRRAEFARESATPNTAVRRRRLDALAGLFSEVAPDLSAAPPARRS